ADPFRARCRVWVPTTRTVRSASVGTSGRHRLERVVAIRWNAWSISVEYALYCGGPAPAGGVFVSASSSRSSWRTTLRPASDYSRRTSASLTCRRGRRPPHELDHFLQTEWDLTRPAFGWTGQDHGHCRQAWR